MAMQALYPLQLHPLPCQPHAWRLSQPLDRHEHQFMSMHGLLGRTRIPPHWLVGAGTAHATAAAPAPLACARAGHGYDQMPKWALFGVSKVDCWGGGQWACARTPLPPYPIHDPSMQSACMMQMPPSFTPLQHRVVSEAVVNFWRPGNATERGGAVPKGVHAQAAILVNGTYPGPPVYANVGDVVSSLSS